MRLLVLEGLLSRRKFPLSPIVVLAVFGLASCGPGEGSASGGAAPKEAALSPDQARAIKYCYDLVARQMMADISPAQQYLADQAMGRDIGSSAMMNPDGRWRALVLRRAEGDGKCTLISAACAVSLEATSATGDFTVKPTFSPQCD